ncbi:MAG: hypothetical protein ACRD7E_23670, partial [Bryobacteraceae bacterium]
AQGFAGLGVGNPLNNDNPIHTFKNDLSWTRGSHTLKFGAEIIRHFKDSINYSNEQGNFNFNGAVTGNAFADFLLGRAFTYTENDRDPGVDISGWANEFYVQDDIRATSRLTINVGVRWYLFRGANGGAAVGDNIAAFVPSLYDPSQAPELLPNGQIVPDTGDPLNGIITGADRKGLPGVGRSLMRPNNDVLGPRFGFAYSLTDKTVLRGGYGINSFWGTANNEGRRNNPPFSTSVNIQGPRLSDPLGGTDRLFPANINSLDVFHKQPTVQSWSFTIQRELMANTSLEVGYAGTRGNHLPRGIQLNQADPARTGNANLRRPYLGYGTIGYNENSAVSKYHALEVSLVRRFSKGLHFETSYTWSKSLGHPEGNPMDSRNKDLDFGLLDLDRTHILSVNYVWEMPFFKGQTGFAAAILRGWQLSGITAFQSGLPANVTQPGDVANFGGGTGGQRPDLVGDPHEGRGESLERYFNTSAFRQVTTPGTLGNAPVNAVREPGINNWDVSLSKIIRPRESLRLQLGIETFNTFNHAQFEGLGTQLGATTFGVVTGARDGRVIQLRAKFSF